MLLTRASAITAVIALAFSAAACAEELAYFGSAQSDLAALGGQPVVSGNWEGPYRPYVLRNDRLVALIDASTIRLSGPGPAQPRRPRRRGAAARRQSARPPGPGSLSLRASDARAREPDRDSGRRRGRGLRVARRADPGLSRRGPAALRPHRRRARAALPARAPSLPALSVLRREDRVGRRSAFPAHSACSTARFRNRASPAKPPRRSRAWRASSTSCASRAGAWG